MSSERVISVSIVAWKVVYLLKEASRKTSVFRGYPLTSSVKQDVSSWVIAYETVNFCPSCEKVYGSFSQFIKSLQAKWVMTLPETSILNN